jgi:hypothetical protein
MEASGPETKEVSWSDGDNSSAKPDWTESETNIGDWRSK